jgi:hypothetical protein
MTPLSVWDEDKKCMVLNPKAFAPYPPDPKTTLVPGVAWDTTVKVKPRPKKRIRIEPSVQFHLDPLAEAKEQLAEIKRKKQHGK